MKNRSDDWSLQRTPLLLVAWWIGGGAEARKCRRDVVAPLVVSPDRGPLALSGSSYQLTADGSISRERHLGQAAMCSPRSVMVRLFRDDAARPTKTMRFYRSTDRGASK